MTREELASQLENFRRAWVAGKRAYRNSWGDRVLADAIAALSSSTPPPGLAGLRAGPVQRSPCACRGREPIGKTFALITLGQSTPGVWEAYVHLLNEPIRISSLESVKDRERVDVLVFARLPASGGEE